MNACLPSYYPPCLGCCCYGTRWGRLVGTPRRHGRQVHRSCSGDRVAARQVSTAAPACPCCRTPLRCMVLCGLLPTNWQLQKAICSTQRVPIAQGGGKEPPWVCHTSCRDCGGIPCLPQAPRPRHPGLSLALPPTPLVTHQGRGNLPPPSQISALMVGCRAAAPWEPVPSSIGRWQGCCPPRATPRDWAGTCGSQAWGICEAAARVARTGPGDGQRADRDPSACLAL